MADALPPTATAPRTVVFCILDGVGWGARDAYDAVAQAKMPTLNRLMEAAPHTLLQAHGKAVGLPSDADMGNSEVGHNAFGAGRVIDQGASLVDKAIASGAIWEGPVWRQVVAHKRVHFLGLVSDGNVHSNVRHLEALVAAAQAAGVETIRVHALTDGRDVSERSALQWLAPLEASLAALPDARIASGGGRMHLTMDRYEADWEMVARGWRCHVHGEGRPFPSAVAAVEALYAEDPKVNDQWLPAFVVVDAAGAPVGQIESGDAVVLFNFRGDRAIEISRAFTEGDFPFFARSAPGRTAPQVFFAGMMQYDGDKKIPASYLVEPPAIDRTVGEYLAAAGRRTFAISETQKFGHVTYFFNGNRSGRWSESLEVYEEIPSDNVPFDQAPKMQAARITARAVEVIRQGAFDHIRLNLANGDMVGHTGSLAATIEALEEVDRCLTALEAAAREAGAVLIVTADHGNADDMVERAKGGQPLLDHGQPKPKTSHTLAPVPFLLIDPRGAWALTPPPTPGIASIGATLLQLHGLTPPSFYLPSLVSPVSETQGTST